MNTSYSKIRHIKESNILLENRRDTLLITEETVIRKVPIYDNIKDRTKVTGYINLMRFREIELERENNAASFNISYTYDDRDRTNRYSKTYICGGGGVMCENIYCRSGEKHTLDAETTKWIETTYCAKSSFRPQGSKPEQKVDQPQNNQPVQNVVQPQGNKPEEKVNQPVQNVVQPQNNKPVQNLTQPNKPAQRLPSF
jgi:hypothetical protein